MFSGKIILVLSLFTGGRICSFSPCIEQVQRTCEELSSQNFTDIVTMECLARHFNLQYAKIQNLSFEASEKVDSEGAAESNEPPVKKASMTPASGDKRGDSNMHQFTSAVPAINMPGHTGFLTFASLTCH